MPSLSQYQSLFKDALDRAPKFLVFDGFYIYKTENAAYDPATDAYGNTEVANTIIKVIRGSKKIGGVNYITFLAESRPFETVPTANGTLLISGESWNILSIDQDPIGLTYAFTVANKDGV